eukprot:sb/3473507/
MLFCGAGGVPLLSISARDASLTMKAISERALSHPYPDTHGGTVMVDFTLTPLQPILAPISLRHPCGQDFTKDVHSQIQGLLKEELGTLEMKLNGEIEESRQATSQLQELLETKVKESEGVVMAAVGELRTQMTQQIDVKIEETQEQVGDT